MEDILVWFRQQNGGIYAFVILLQKITKHAQDDTVDPALSALLSGIIRTYVANYEEMPLSIEVATEAQRRMDDLLTRSCRFDELAPAGQVDFLNELARIELG